MKKKFIKNNNVSNKTSRFMPQKKQRVCALKEVDSADINYRNISLLSGFVSNGGRILPRRATMLCCKHQRKMRSLVKIARFLSLLPFCPNHR